MRTFGATREDFGRIAVDQRSNALKNGLIPVQVDSDTHRWLLQHPGAGGHPHEMPGHCHHAASPCRARGVPTGKVTSPMGEDAFS